jgi:hypothetical protein
MEARNGGCLAVHGPQERDCGDGLHRSGIIERQLNRKAVEVIVEGDAVGDKSATRLKQYVNMPHIAVASDTNSIEDSLDGGLINPVGKGAIDLWWQYGGLAGHWATLSQSMPGSPGLKYGGGLAHDGE